MLGYIVRRLISVIPVLVIISIITFGLMHMVPGNPFEHLDDQPLPQETIDRLKEHYKLDQPVWKQYLLYMREVLKGNLGPSYLYGNRTVNEMIWQGFPISACLGLVALAIAIVTGIPLGILSALRQNTLVDYFCMFFAVSGVSIHKIAMAPLLIYVFALKLDLFPVALWGTWQHAVLPAIALAFNPAAIFARLTRASMLRVLHEDYIRTARAKGVPEIMVTIKHALRNALIPVVTVIGPITASLVIGSLIIEKIFSINGVGNYFVNGVSTRDYPVIMGMTLLYAFILVISNLLVDISYAWIDPRITLK